MPVAYIVSSAWVPMIAAAGVEASTLAVERIALASWLYSSVTVRGRSSLLLARARRSTSSTVSGTPDESVASSGGRSGPLIRSISSKMVSAW